MSIKYDCFDSCNRCGVGVNEIKVKDSINGQISEAETKCKDCGHSDYWAYGFFESSKDIISRCEKYSFEVKQNGR